MIEFEPTATGNGSFEATATVSFKLVLDIYTNHFVHRYRYTNGFANPRDSKWNEK